MDGIFPAGVKAADGWLVTGSKFGVYESHDWIGLLEEFLREAYAGNVPIVGICFGHQILAQALGGKAEKFKRGWSVGVEAYSLDGHCEEARLIAWLSILLPAGLPIKSSNFSSVPVSATIDS